MVIATRVIDILFFLSCYSRYVFVGTAYPPQGSGSITEKRGSQATDPVTFESRNKQLVFAGSWQRCDRLQPDRAL